MVFLFCKHTQVLNCTENTACLLMKLSREESNWIACSGAVMYTTAVIHYVLYIVTVMLVELVATIHNESRGILQHSAN